MYIFAKDHIPIEGIPRGCSTTVLINNSSVQIVHDKYHYFICPRCLTNDHKRLEIENGKVFCSDCKYSNKRKKRNKEDRALYSKEVLDELKYSMFYAGGSIDDLDFLIDLELQLFK